VIQRFGSGLQLNVHGHALFLDGVFTEAAIGSLRFASGELFAGRDAGGRGTTRPL
jgi:hypothetical protein